MTMTRLNSQPPAIVVRRVDLAYTKGSSGKIGSVTAPTAPSGYVFVSWVNATTIGMATYAGMSKAADVTTSVYVPWAASQSGTIRCTALYVRM